MREIIHNSQYSILAGYALLSKAWAELLYHNWMLNPAMASDHFVAEQENAPLHQTPDHSRTADAAEPISEEVERASVKVTIVVTEQTSSGSADQTALEDENSDGTDQNVNHESVLNGTSVPELTKDSPPSYENVVKTIPTNTEISTGDNNTNGITIQPQSSIVNSPMVDSANSNCDTLDPEAELTARIEYLRRRRRERKNMDPGVEWKNEYLFICCIICVSLICAPFMLLSVLGALLGAGG